MKRAALTGAVMTVLIGAAGCGPSAEQVRQAQAEAEQAQIDTERAQVPQYASGTNLYLMAALVNSGIKHKGNTLYW